MKAVVIAAAAVGMLFVGLLLSVAVLFSPSTAEASPSCDPAAGSPAAAGGSASTVGVAAPASVGSWSGEQLHNAALVIDAGVPLRISPRGQAIAVMTAMKESSLRVLNYGDAAGPDSRGLFQQRANGAWGSLADRMDPTTSATNFYRALLAVDGWESLPPTTAAHRVQRNADPNAYTEVWDDAVQVLAALTSVDLGTAGGAAGSDAAVCGDDVPVISDGAHAFPLPLNSGYSDRDNYGHSGSLWSSIHTGDDLSVACGTPVLAAHAGTVLLHHSDGGSWAGPNFVEITQGTGKFTTWYAHMRTAAVSDGQQVVAGQRLGEVGDLGNATGCHLHFEIHPQGGRYRQDQIDPHPWLLALLAAAGTSATTQ